MTNRKTQMVLDIAAAKRKDQQAWDRVQERQDTLDVICKDIDFAKANGHVALAQHLIETKKKREQELSVILRILNK